MKASRAAVLIAGAVVAACGGIALWAVYGPNHFRGWDDGTFVVSRGQTLASVTDSLDARGLIRSKTLFTLTARILGGADRLQIGKYRVASGVSNGELMRMMREGTGIVSVRVTLREGIRSRTQARVFRRDIGADSARFAALVHDPEFAASLGVPAPSLEGYLFPETYQFHWQTDEKEILRRLVAHFRQFYSDSLQRRAAQLGMTTNEVITFASIVEAEAALPEERALIAGVYHNRLRRGMKLEADPTVQFAIPDGPKRLLYSDLKYDSPYNTYLYKGLPPGPINNPGREAILAVLFPLRHTYIYFVANGRGGHWFSSTYADHQKYVRMYRKLRSQDQSSAIPSSAETTKAPA